MDLGLQRFEGARETLKESSRIRKTRTGDILIELKEGSNAKKTAADMNTALRGKVRALPMRDKTLRRDQGYRPARRQGRTSQGDSSATGRKRHH